MTLSLLGFLNTSAWEAMWIKELFIGYVVHEVAATALLPWSQRFFYIFFFFVKERASLEAATMKRKFLSYGKLKPELVRKDFKQ